MYTCAYIIYVSMYKYACMFVRCMFACKYVGFACRIMAILFGCNVCEWGRRARVRGAALFTYRCMFECVRGSKGGQRDYQKETHTMKEGARVHTRRPAGQFAQVV